MPQQKRESKPKKETENYLSEDQIVEMIKLWQDFSEIEIAEKISTDLKTVGIYANLLRKEDPTVCVKKRKTRHAAVLEALKRHNASKVTTKEPFHMEE